jgi:hypothetical protein
MPSSASGRKTLELPSGGAGVSIPAVSPPQVYLAVTGSARHKRLTVLWARGLLYASDEAYSFDDESICNTGARVTNVFETAPSMLAIQPNPTDGLVHVTLPQEGTYHARIFNSIGSLVQEQNLNGGQQTIRFKPGLSTGAYWIRIDGKSSEFSAQSKVVLNR